MIQNLKSKTLMSGSVMKFGGLLGCFIIFLLFACGDSCTEREKTSSELTIAGWDSLFSYHYAYTVKEEMGNDRTAEPVEVTLSAKSGELSNWQDEIRIVRVDTSKKPELVAFQVYGQVTAEAPPTESANIVFIATCPAYQQVTYHLYWGKVSAKPLPTAPFPTDLRIEGTAPGLTVQNAFYRIELSQKCGAIQTARRAGQDDEHDMRFYQKLPMHFGADVWSPPAAWDHDYDWESPPNAHVIEGPVMVKYHRWGPLKSYQDVIVHLTYTFYAGVPYVKTASMMEFTENRSARAVRLGEIVVTHLASKGHSREPEIDSTDIVFTHYAWQEAGKIVTREIAAHLDSQNVAVIEGIARGGLAILDRDVPWVAGYHTSKKVGIASLRKSHFVGNRYGNPIPFTAACTYLAQYGWGFTYWSRPEVYPFGLRKTTLDHNAVVSRGTLFAAEEALMIFEPKDNLKDVQNAYVSFTHPLKLQFKGTGPW
ncbi:hypothetical protein JXJ21_17090 [candidate division KSB1 bacterium]|nr:hypothetical protein [candidate division KSB1 bacterium]